MAVGLESALSENGSINAMTRDGSRVCSREVSTKPRAGLDNEMLWTKLWCAFPEILAKAVRWRVTERRPQQ